MGYPKWKDNGRIKLMIIVGTRPEIIRLAAVIKKCRNYFDTILVHTGQNYDHNLNGIFFKDLRLADPELYLASENITKKCTQRYRGWDQVLIQLIVLYGERLTQYRTLIRET